MRGGPLACLAALLLALAACGGGDADPVTRSDSGATDAGVTDAGAPDAGTPDAGPPDSGVPDAGASLVLPLHAAVTAGAPQVTAGSALVLTLTVTDDAGAPVAGAQAEASVTGQDNTLSGNTTTDASGTLDYTFRSTTAEPKALHVQVTFGEATAEASFDFTVVPGSVSAAHSTVTADATTAVADGASTVHVRAILQDEHFNPVLGAPVELTPTPADGAHCAPASASTDADGKADFACTFTQAGDFALQVTSGGTSVGTKTVHVTASALTLAATLSATAAQVAAGEALTVTLTVTDGAGNPVEGATSSLEATGTGNTVTGGATTDATGTLTFTFSSTVAEAKHLTATVSRGDVTAQSSPLPLTVVPGTPNWSQTTLTSDTLSVYADGMDAAHLMLTVRDAYANPLTGVDVSVSAMPADGVTCTPASTTTDALGAAAFSCTFTQAQPSGVTLSFTAGGTEVHRQLLGVLPAADPTTSSLDASATQALVGENLFLTAHARDAEGHPVTSAEIHFTATPSVAFTPSADILTESNGDAIVLVQASTPGPRTFTATMGETLLGTVEVTFIPPANEAASTFSLLADPIPAGSTSTVHVQLATGDGQPAPGLQAALFSGDGVTLLTPEALQPSTDASGEADLTAVLSTPGPVALEVCVSAKAPIQDTSDCLFLHPLTQRVLGPPGPSSSLTSDVQTAQANQPIQLTLHLVDANGWAVPNVDVTLEATGSDNTLSRTSGTTDVNGELAFTFLSLTSEAKTITAKVGGAVVAQETVTITAAPAAWVLIEWPSTLHSGDIFTVVEKAVDDWGNVDPTYVGSGTVGLNSAWPGEVTLGGTTSRPFVSGVATFDDLWMEATPGDRGKFHATAPGLDENVTDLVTVLPDVWTPISTSGDFSGAVTELQLSPGDPNVLFAAGADGVSRGALGASPLWTALGPGRAVQHVAIDPLDATHLLALIGGDAFRYAGGTSWVDLPLGNTATPLALVFDPTDSTHLYASTGGDGVLGSTDGGAHFQVIGLAGKQVYQLAFGTDAEHTLYAMVADDWTVYRLAPDLSWQPLREGLPSGIPGYAISLAIGPGGAVYVGTQSGVFALGPDGTWERRATTSDPVRLYAVAPGDSDTLYSTLGRSTDGGRTWTLPSLSGTGLRQDQWPQISSVAIDPGDANLVYLSVGEASVYRSTSGGF